MQAVRCSLPLKHFLSLFLLFPSLQHSPGLPGAKRRLPCEQPPSRRYCAQVAVSSPISRAKEPPKGRVCGTESRKHLQLPPQWPRVLTDGLHGRTSMPQRGDDDKHFVFSSRGIDPYDKPNTIYVERHEPSGYSTVFRSTDFFQSRENLEVILEEVRDFQLRDKYMFATKVVVS